MARRGLLGGLNKCSLELQRDITEVMEQFHCREVDAANILLQLKAEKVGWESDIDVPLRPSR